MKRQLRLPKPRPRQKDTLRNEDNSCLGPMLDPLMGTGTREALLPPALAMRVPEARAVVGPAIEKSLRWNTCWNKEVGNQVVDPWDITDAKQFLRQH